MIWSSVFFFSSRRRHTRFDCDWSSDVCSSDLWLRGARAPAPHRVADRGRPAPQHLAVERRGVTGMIDQGGRWHGIFHDYSNPSFMDLLRREAPHLMPTASPSPTETPREPPHGTTVLSVRYRDGVILAGDPQARCGFQGPSRGT